MEKFLEMYKLQRPITSNEIESAIKKKKKILTNKSPGPDSFRGEFYQTFREVITHILLKLLPQNVSQLILRGQHHLDTKTKDVTHTERKLQANSLMNIDAKILNKI